MDRQYVGMVGDDVAQHRFASRFTLWHALQHLGIVGIYQYQRHDHASLFGRDPTADSFLVAPMSSRGEGQKPDVENLLTDRRMCLDRRLDMRACHPAPALCRDRLL